MCARQAQTAEHQGGRTCKMSGRASVIAKKGAVRDLARGAGRPRGRRADRPRVGSLPPPNRYVREMTDSSNRKLPFCGFQTGQLFSFFNKLPYASPYSMIPLKRRGDAHAC
jgi:hypothetical protein